MQENREQTKLSLWAIDLADYPGSYQSICTSPELAEKAMKYLVKTWGLPPEQADRTFAVREFQIPVNTVMDGNKLISLDNLEPGDGK